MIDINSSREEVLVAVAQYGGALQYTSEALKSDRDLVLTAVAQCGGALEYASEALKSDREVALVAVAQFGFALKYASEDLKSDKEMVLAAVSNCGLYLKYASEALKSDREVVLAAVAEFGSVLKYASEDLKSDREVVFTALTNDKCVSHNLCEAESNNIKSFLNFVKKHGKENSLNALKHKGVVLQKLIAKNIISKFDEASNEEIGFYSLPIELQNLIFNHLDHNPYDPAIPTLRGCLGVVESE